MQLLSGHKMAKSIKMERDTAMRPLKQLFELEAR